MQHQIARQIILQPVEALIPYARNSRTHSDEQVAQIAASIREFGFTNPVLVDDDGGIVAGHGRVMAARQIGMTAVPTINVGWLSEQQRRAYVIADNKLALNAGWDDEMLGLELSELGDAGFDLELIGFTQEEIDALGAENGGGEETLGDEPKGNLSDRFMIPPFSVLNAREGWWQNRKRAWLALGIKSELGRGGGLTMEAKQVTSAGLNFYRDEKKQRQAAAPGRPATTAKNSAATARGGR